MADITVEGKCRYCGIPISLTVDSDYKELGDPYDLIQMAACDRCANYRSKIRPIYESIRTHCMWGEQKLYNTPILKEKAVENLRGLLAAYINLLATHRHLTPGQVDEGIIEGLMNHPAEFVKIMRRVSAAYQQKNLL